MRPIATDVQQWRGQSIHAAYCYRRAAVAWSVHPCGLLLQTCSSGVVSPSMRPIATDTQQWRGQSVHAAYCYRHAAVAWSVHPCGLLLQTRSSGVVGPSMRPIATDVQQWRGQSIHALNLIKATDMLQKDTTVCVIDAQFTCYKPNCPAATSCWVSCYCLLARLFY